MYNIDYRKNHITQQQQNKNIMLVSYLFITDLIVVNDYIMKSIYK